MDKVSQTPNFHSQQQPAASKYDEEIPDLSHESSPQQQLVTDNGHIVHRLECRGKDPFGTDGVHPSHLHLHFPSLPFSDLSLSLSDVSESSQEWAPDPCNLRDSPVQVKGGKTGRKSDNHTYTPSFPCFLLKVGVFFVIVQQDKTKLDQTIKTNAKEKERKRYKTLLAPNQSLFRDPLHDHRSNTF